MISGFWKKLKKPIFALAPMSNVTDAAFRFILAKYGKPDVMWTEFVSCDGLCSSGRDALMVDLKYSNKERPIVVQIFGSKPDNFYKTALLMQEFGFDGIDINMGCPDKNIEKQGAGAKLMLNPKLAQEIIKETKRGAGKLPVSIKTRLGYNKNILEEWLPALLETEPAAIIIHARTRKEMSLVPAHWEEIAKAVEIRNNYNRSPDKTLILGNGDVASRQDGEEKVKFSGADGVMVGRGTLGNPWFFCKKKNIADITREERLKALMEHTFLFEKLLGGRKSFDIMKKHFKAYIGGFSRAKELRVRLMKTKNASEVEKIVSEYLMA